MHKYIVILSCLFTSYPTFSSPQNLKSQDQWLEDRFSQQHQSIMPIVAVADMLFGCQQSKKLTPAYDITFLVTTMPKNELSEKLISCLGEASIKTEKAIDYGLLGCFHEQLKHIPETERKAQFMLVKNAIKQLSKVEKQQSLTKCVNEQAIQYLQ